MADDAHYIPQQQLATQRLARAAALELEEANATEETASTTGFYMAAIV